MTVASLLPPNATKLERALEATTARVGDVPLPLRPLWNPATCPIEILPWLAWSLSIDFWDPEWPEAFKRAQVAGAIAFHRRKGTRGAVREVVETYDVGITISEWFEQDPPASPYTFQIDLPLTGDDGDIGSAAFAERVASEVARTKPVRAHFDFRQRLGTGGGVGLTGAARGAIYARLPMSADLVADTSPWAGVLLTENGEPVFTDGGVDGDRLEIDP